MDKEEMIVTYRGTDVRELSRDKLIDALYECMDIQKRDQDFYRRSTNFMYNLRNGE